MLKRVEIINCEVGGIVDEKGHKIAKVIIDAVLKKNINFKAMLKDCPDGRDFDRHDKKDDDILAPGETRVRCGDLRTCFVQQRNQLHPPRRPLGQALHPPTHDGH